MLPDGCKTRYCATKRKEVPQERPESCIRHHYEEPAVECGIHRNGLTRQKTRHKEAMLNGLNAWDNDREESPAQP